MIAVGPAADDVQEKIDLGRREGSERGFAG
jgi:hypothetical protein